MATRWRQRLSNSRTWLFSSRTMMTGGRAQVRRALYMAVVSAVRSNPLIKNFYAHLRARGKYS